MLVAGPKRAQSPAEEVANSISHSVGLAAALVGAPILITHVARQGDTGVLAGSMVFSTTIILLYLSSSLYHALPPGKAKGIARVVEHSAIFLLIAGTYTPFTLGVLRGPWGWTLFGIVWGLAAVGVALKVFVRTPRPILSTSLYLLMGWIIAIAPGPVLAHLPTDGLLWLVAGGLSYTLGVVFFATDSRVPYGHLIWHLFVITGTVCHYFAVFWYAG